MSSLTISRFRMAPSSDGLSTKFVTIIAAVSVVLLAGSPVTAEAHGGRHGSPHMATEGRVHLAGGQRRGNDAYTKASSEDREKLLESRLKDIGRGC